jgi:polar amino acid transport system substrate-binding protein
MKQIVQDPRRGVVGVEEVPIPALKSGGVLIRTVASSVSPGTERLALEFGRKSLLRKAWERPDLVQQILDKARREGVVSAYMGVKSRLDSPISLGYSSAGIVEGVGDGTGDFQIGDRVACAGAGYASHAEMVWVPMNLCVHVPDNVSLDDAAFTTMGAIALQGLRLAEPTLGEYVVVIGLGLIGQIVLQCLKATGCHVFGIDREADRVALACELGADEAALDDKASIVKRVSAFARGRGADAVIIAAATESSGPIELAGEICRQKGRVVVVGAVGMNIPRRSYYDRELTVKVSMSYGPGRYDPIYEEKGIDYPIGYVRWTERRNMEAFLDLLAEAKVNLQRLITPTIFWPGREMRDILEFFLLMPIELMQGELLLFLQISRLSPLLPIG